MRTRALIGVALVLSAAGVGAAGQVFRPQDADSLERKIAQIVQFGAALESAEAAENGRSSARTIISEREFNSYFKFQGAQYLPTGVIEPVITIAETGRVTARVIVDLDAVRSAKPRSITDPLAWVSGRLELRAAGTLSAANGQGRLVFESATLDGKNIPKQVLQELIAFYTRTPESPGGFNLDQAFALPQRIRSAEFLRGSVVLVQ
jgi:hypothetical protein